MPRHSTVAAYAALFVALGGASYAAVNLPKDSVRAKQIDKNAVRTAEVKNGSLLCADFNPSEPACRVAASAVRSNRQSVAMSCQESEPFPGSFFVSCNGQATITASCNPGERATGGGYETPPTSTSGSQISTAAITQDRPDPVSGTPNGWAVRVTASGANSGTSPGLARPPDPEVIVYAVCES